MAGDKAQQGRHKIGLILLWLGLFWAAAFVHQRQYRFATPVSRLDALHALVEHGTLEIDQWHTNTTDKAVVNGHYYSDKAPGTIAVGFAPFYIASALLKAAGTPLDSRTGWLATSWITCASTLALAFAFGGVAAYKFLSTRFDPRTAFTCVVGAWLGGMPLAFTGALWSHTLVMGLIALAICILELGTGTMRRSHAMIAGFVLGLALASEYTAGIVIVAIALSAYRKLRESGQLMSFIAAAIPPLLLIPAYSMATVGSPFALPYSYQASFPPMKEGIYAIKWPRIDILARLLIGPERGLFWYCPFLFIAVVGFARMAAGADRRLWLWLGVPALTALVISGRAWDWTAGDCFGPRLLAPIVPLLMVGCAVGAQMFQRTAIVLAVISALHCLQASLTSTLVPADRYWAMVELNWDLWRRGVLSYNLGTTLGLSKTASVALFCGVLFTALALAWHFLKQPKAMESVPRGC